MQNFVNLHHFNKTYIANNSNTYILKNTENDLAEFINNNLHLMTNEEKKYMLFKCMNDTNYHNELLKYEFNNFLPKTKNMTIDEFKSDASKYIKRYQHKVGGFMLEDSEWSMITNISEKNKYNLSENEVVFENTMPLVSNFSNTLKTDMSIINNVGDVKETLIYLKKLTKLLNLISSNVKVQQKFIEIYRDDIIVVILHCKLISQIT